MSGLTIVLNGHGDKNSTGGFISVDALGHLILNKARMMDWLNAHKAELRDAASYDLKDIYGNE